MNQILIFSIVIIVSAISAIQLVNGQELLNTATNKVEFVQDIAERDALEDIMINLETSAQENNSTFILVEQPNQEVTLFTINYPYEDYQQTDLPMIELGTFELMELVN